MKPYLSIILFAAVALFGCGKTTKAHRKKPNLHAHLELKQHVPVPAHRQVGKLIPLDNGQYAYHKSGSDFWFYMWLLNSNSHTTSIQYVERSSYSPVQMGYVATIGTAAPKEVVLTEDEDIDSKAEVADPGMIDAEDTVAVAEAEQENSEVDQANTEIEASNAAMDAQDAAAIAAFENEGGNNGPSDETNEGGNESSNSDPSGSEPGGSGGGADSSGGDSGGGGDGGGGGSD